MSDSVVEGPFSKSSQQNESLMSQDNDTPGDDMRAVEGSAMDSIRTGTPSPKSPHFTDRPERRERTLRQRKQVNYAELPDNPLKDPGYIQSQYNHSLNNSAPPARKRGRPRKYPQGQTRKAEDHNHLRTGATIETLRSSSRFTSQYTRRGHQAEEDDDEDNQNDDYQSVRKKVRRLSQHQETQMNGSTRYNMRTRSKGADYSVDNRDNEGDDEDEGDDDERRINRNEKRILRKQSRVDNSIVDTGSPSVDEERIPNSQYSLRSRKNISYSESHLRPDYGSRASPSPKGFATYREARRSRWQMSNDANGESRNIPSEKAYHLRKRAHPPNFYAVPPPPLIPPKIPSSRPQRSLRGISLYRQMGSGSSDEESVRRNVKQLRGGESGSKILPLNLLELRGSRDDSLLGPSVLNDQTSISEKVDGQAFNFESIGGLDHHIKSLKEMILLPLLYPELYAKFQITPPRGALLYGPPGTGKTLMARALANSCSTQSQKVAFFMRKGADCLSKWVGEAERELKLLFEEAKKWQPSIIFFDEIDGLAPVRSAKAEQTHTSVVSTLLALMDGLDSRGQVIVLGATNRIDAIDPALRRPGRFDREFYFPLPSEEARLTIVDIATRGWQPPIPAEFKRKLAQVSRGYSGADLKALCSEAALNSIRRTYPQIYDSSDRLLVSPQNVHVEQHDFLDSAKTLVPSSHRSADSVAAPLPDAVAILLRSQFNEIKESVFQIISRKTNNPLLSDEDFEEGSHSLWAEQEHFTLTGSSEIRTFKPRLLISGEQGLGQKHVAAAILDALDGHHVQSFDLAMLMGDSVRTPEAICVQLFTEVKRHRPGVIYIPHIHIWWHTVSDMLRLTFINLLNDINPHHPILLLATSEMPFESLPSDIRKLFKHCMLGNISLRHANQDERAEFFGGILVRALKTPHDYLRRQKIESEQAQVQLKKAPPLPPRQLTDAEKQKLKRHDIHVLREFRRELRCIVEDLLKSKRYKYFAHPDNEEYPEYNILVRHPMDLNKIMHKINEGKYFLVEDFLHDIHIIRYNTEFYHGASDDLTIRAYSLVDDVESFVHALNPELIAELMATAKRRKLVRGEEKKVVNHKYYTRTASERRVTTRSMEKKINDATPVEDNEEPDNSEYVNKLLDTYDSGFQNNLFGKDPLSGSDTEEINSTLEANGRSQLVADSANESSPLPFEPKEPTVPQREPTLSSLTSEIIVDFENNPFAVIIEKETVENSQGDAEHPLQANRDKLETVAEDKENETTAPLENNASDAPENDDKEIILPTEPSEELTADGAEVSAATEENNENDISEPIKEPEFIIDQEAFQELLHSIVNVSNGWSADELCHLRAEMFFSVHKHRMNWDKTELLKDLVKILQQFSSTRTTPFRERVFRTSKMLEK